MKSILVALFLAAPLCAQSNPNLAYATLGGTNLLLDLYVPSVGVAPYPCVVWIHGGGWSGGSRFPLPASAQGLVDRGIAVASVDYRLTSQAGQYGTNSVTFPAQIEDVKGAVRWLRANASTYGLDPTRFGSWGSSAGGHLSALLATSGGVGALEGATGGNLGFSSAVQCAADYFGPVDLLQMNPDVTTPPGSALDHDANTSPESHLIGFDGPGEGIGVLRANIGNPAAPFPFFAQLVSWTNPITWLDASDPPIFASHGSADTSVPWNQSRRLANAMNALGLPVTFHLQIGAPHGALGLPVDATTADFFAQRFFGALAPMTLCGGDGIASGCPCGNLGYLRHGCANSQLSSIGAILAAAGNAIPDSLSLSALGMNPASSCVFFQGDATTATPVFTGDGARCAGGALLRLSTKVASQGGAKFPGLGDPSIRARSAALGAPIPPGAARVYQVYYRDVSMTFCPAPTGGTSNLTNAVRVVWP